MQIAIPMNSDEAMRLTALQSAQWFYDAAAIEPDTAEQVVSTATLFEHYLTNGQTVAFDCEDRLHKTVRG